MRGEQVSAQFYKQNSDNTVYQPMRKLIVSDPPFFGDTRPMHCSRRIFGRNVH